jgi:hypothetical protein
MYTRGTPWSRGEATSRSPGQDQPGAGAVYAWPNTACAPLRGLEASASSRGPEWSASGRWSCSSRSVRTSSSQCWNAVRPSLPSLHSILPSHLTALLLSTRQGRRFRYHGPRASLPRSPSFAATAYRQPPMDRTTSPPKARSRRGRKPQNADAVPLSPRTRQRNKRARDRAEKKAREDEQRRPKGDRATQVSHTDGYCS